MHMEYNQYSFLRQFPVMVNSSVPVMAMHPHSHGILLKSTPQLEYNFQLMMSYHGGESCLETKTRMLKLNPEEYW